MFKIAASQNKGVYPGVCFFCHRRWCKCQTHTRTPDDLMELLLHAIRSLPNHHYRVNILTIPTILSLASLKTTVHSYHCYHVIITYYNTGGPYRLGGGKCALVHLLILVLYKSFVCLLTFLPYFLPSLYFLHYLFTSLIINNKIIKIKFPLGFVQHCKVRRYRGSYPSWVIYYGTSRIDPSISRPKVVGGDQTWL